MVDVDSKRADELGQAQAHLSDITSRFFWYEFTPYEVGCDEIGGERVPPTYAHARGLNYRTAWIPSWSFGREFYNGRNLERRVRLDFTSVFTSANTGVILSLNLVSRFWQGELSCCL